MNRASRPAAVTGAGSEQQGKSGKRYVTASTMGVLSCAVAAGLVIPADAAVTRGHIISVLKDESTISAEGFRTNDLVRVKVLRRGVVVGAVAGRSDGTFEVNHDFCWDRFTPTMRAGDVVRFKSHARVDTVRLVNVRLTEGPTLTGTDSFTIRGTVTPRVPEDQLVAEARTNDPIRFRPLAPDTVDGVVGTIGYDGPTGGNFTASFTGMNAQQQEAFNNLSEPSVQVAPAANEAVIATGATEPVPGPGCALEAPVVNRAVTAVTPRTISKRNARSGLQVQGIAAGTAVRVQLRDADGTTLTRAANERAGDGTWTARVPRTALRRLSGRVSVAALVDGTRARLAMTVLKDLRAPKRPSASIASGTFSRAQFVSLNAGRGEQIRYTLGNGRQAAPTRNRGKVYRGGQIRIDRSRVLKMRAIDAAGNMSKVARRVYTIR
ncbi:MAG: chitobiase/beta-hexosaminidase C-terminal domain-containing protein [Actinomycetota bacterium]|nr:chitobiase/beta-hexosaminidase C-terminal domain-containing protein [Actinomycetota bacterium]